MRQKRNHDKTCKRGKKQQSNRRNRVPETIVGGVMCKGNMKRGKGGYMAQDLVHHLARPSFCHDKASLLTMTLTTMKMMTMC